MTVEMTVELDVGMDVEVALPMSVGISTERWTQNSLTPEEAHLAGKGHLPRQRHGVSVRNNASAGQPLRVGFELLQVDQT